MMAALSLITVQNLAIIQVTKTLPPNAPTPLVTWSITAPSYDLLETLITRDLEFVKD